MFVIFDLDGTIAEVGKSASAETISLIQKIRKAGARIAFSSGKPTFYLCGFARQMGIFDAVLIGENGAVIQEGIELPPLFYKKAAIPEKTSEALFQLRKKMEAAFPDRIWYQPNETELTPFPYYKEDFAPIRKMIEEFIQPEMQLAFYEHSDCFDIVYRHLSKGEGICRLAELADCPAQEMIAVGDYTNDYPMFEKVGYSVGIDLPEPDRANANFKTIEEALLHILEKIS